MAKSKKQSDVVDSTNFPILELTSSKTPIFQSILHPELPIIITGFGTGHIVCHRYNPTKLQSSLNQRRKLDVAALDKDPKSNSKTKKGTCLWTRLDMDVENGTLKSVEADRRRTKNGTKQRLGRGNPLEDQKA